MGWSVESDRTEGHGKTGKRWTPSATSGGLKACLSNLFGFRPDSETTCGVMWPHTLPDRVTTHAPKSVPSNQSNLVSDNWLKKEKWACLYSVQPYTSLPCFSLSLCFFYRLWNCSQSKGKNKALLRTSYWTQQGHALVWKLETKTLEIVIYFNRRNKMLILYVFFGSLDETPLFHSTSWQFFYK